MMKGISIKSVLVISIIIAVAAGCKKNDNGTPKKFVLSSLADSSGVDLVTFTYDGSGNLIRFGAGTTQYNFYFSNGRVTARSYTDNGVLQNTDSFFYDGDNKVLLIKDYSRFNNKLSNTAFTYNGDNTVNSATTTFDSTTNHELHEYTYSSGKLISRKDYVKDAGVFKVKTLSEFLDYDNVANPFALIQPKYLIDQFTFFEFVWSWPNNVTSFKQTQYDLTGGITNVYSETVVYTYNSDGLPVTATFSNGSTTLVYTFKYQQL